MNRNFGISSKQSKFSKNKPPLYLPSSLSTSTPSLNPPLSIAAYSSKSGEKIQFFPIFLGQAKSKKNAIRHLVNISNNNKLVPTGSPVRLYSLISRHFSPATNSLTFMTKSSPRINNRAALPSFDRFFEKKNPSSTGSSSNSLHSSSLVLARKKSLPDQSKQQSDIPADTEPAVDFAEEAQSSEAKNTAALPKSVEETYMRKTPVEHVLLRPDTFDPPPKKKTFFFLPIIDENEMQLRRKHGTS